DVPVNGYVFTPPYMESAAGGLVSTAEDMAKWEIALENGTILGAAALAQMAVPVKSKNDSIAQESDGTRHGLGWDLPTYRGHRIIAHGEIGRASCRERVAASAGAGSLRRKVRGLG